MQKEINFMIRLSEVFDGKKVLVTGHTGFKGSWLSVWLARLGARVTGYSDGIQTHPSHFEVANLNGLVTHVLGDVRDAVRLKKVVTDLAPDFVFHLAAQPLVRLSYAEPQRTMETNFMGTTNMLEALRSLQSPCTAVMITSDKCYDNVEQVWGYRETDALGGADPYSASKGAAELAIRAYAKSYFSSDESPIRVAVARAGNVIGGGDWAVDRIVPDCVRAWTNGEPVLVRNPGATRPWQHVLEPLSGYLTLAARLHSEPVLKGEPFNFGPPAHQNHSVADLIDRMQSYWPSSRRAPTNESAQVYESGLLKLCCDKALQLLGWQPVLNFEETVSFTAEWYRSYYDAQVGKSVLKYTEYQIANYEALAAERGAIWQGATP
jgi:CDP-glucose 4,6-dehydratase